MEHGTILLLLYVDDTVGISSLKLFLSCQFEMKDLGLFSYFLGLEISHDSFGYFLSYAKNTSNLLACTGLTNCKIDCLYSITLPDIAYAVHIVNQFMVVPRSPHYDALLHAFSDADWAGDPTDRRFTTGFCVFLGDSLIVWRSKKQTPIARSSIEAEYHALADTTQELV
ncbi:uncharacterized protein LOC114314027 [Camellia sinensis]|uniref:uncharacterized protein LOC114314027 n=1 Tax=Camellia sinensis TaxID=4442 RepID=UPI001035CB97|nr:uncharacterized protein LOC114314027 [Camellia sinensis]